MRRYLAMVAAAAFVVAAGSAQAATHVRIRTTLSATGHTVLYGHSVKIAGHVSNGRAGQQVTIFAHPYGATSATPVTTVVTRRGGSFAYFAHPSIQTAYTAHFGSTTSRAITVGVRPVINAHELSNGQVGVSVRAGRSFTGRFVRLQQQQGDGTWKTVGQRPLDSASAVTFGPLLSSSRIRVAMSVNEAGKGYLGGYSGVVGYHTFRLTLMPASLSVTYGNSVELAGHLVNGRAGETIELYATPYGRSTTIHVATVRTTTGGMWSFRVRPLILTRYQAIWSGTEKSPLVHVDVKPLITVRELANGKVRAQVRLGKSVAGRTVKLQQQMSNGGWQTVLQRPLGPASTATFPAGSSTTRIRIAMSVNEAGKGYLGGFSHVLAYKAK